MNDAVIVVNAGSSSLKFSLYSIAADQLVLDARGQIEGLAGNPHFIAKDRQGGILADSATNDASRARGAASDASDDAHARAFTYLLRWLRDQFGDRMAPFAVGHRVVHGGAEFIRPTLIDANVLIRLAHLAPLAPLHQSHNLAAIQAVVRLQPDLPQVACFDTAFHHGRAIGNKKTLPAGKGQKLGY